MVIPVIESQSVPWPPLYKEATEKFSGQVKLSADDLKGGKILWRSRVGTTDDLDVRALSGAGRRLAGSAR